MLDRNRTGPGFRAQIPLYLKEGILSTTTQINVLEGVTGTAPIVAGAIAAKSQAISITAATTGAAGSMSAADKTKIDAYPAYAATGLATPVAWAAPTLNTDWSNYSGAFTQAGYRKDALGMVQLKGLVKKSSAVSTPDTIFTLPVGFRPTTEKLFTVTSNLTAGEVRVTTGGAVNVLAGDANYVSLDGLSFDPTT